MSKKKLRMLMRVCSNLVVLFSVVVFAVACYHKFSSPAENAEIDYPIPENAEVVVGDVGPVNFPNANKTTQDDDVKFGITNSARAFYLPKNIHTDHPEYYDLLTTDRKPNILKLTLGNDGEHKGTPIINVELPNEEEYFRAKAMWEYGNQPTEESNISEDTEIIIDNARLFKSSENGKQITTFERDVGVIMMNNSTKQFYLPRNIQHYNEYYDLLNFPNDILNILKLTIGKKNHKGFPIIKVEVPNRQERLQVITNLLSSEKNADEDIDYSTPENTCAEILVDNISLLNFPNEDPKTQDGDIKIAMGISARAFYLPKNIHTDHPEYYDLLTADRKPNILKLTLGNTTNKGIPIINVELPDETSTAYLKVKERREYFQAQEEGKLEQS